MRIQTALVIDRKKTGVDHLLSLLNTQKIATITVESVDAARRYLSSHKVDVIFTDQETMSFFQREQLPLCDLTTTSLDPLLSPHTPSSTSETIIESPQMRALFEAAERVAHSEASVFITGESGTGKEVLARFIHLHSMRASHPFVAVNCAAIPEALLEAEFFGHVKGAFTGAIAEREGRFERAHRGTLLLDEVTEIPLHVQAKLLRAVQEQSFEKIGSDTQCTVSIRFIATSNRTIETAIEQGIFREDLFYRLGVVPFHIPPLRERIEDIAPLATSFLRAACMKNHLSSKTLHPHAIKTLEAYAWPGNVRELANVIEHAAVLAEGSCIESVSLPQRHGSPLHSPEYPFSGWSLKDVEHAHITETLAQCNQNKTRAAAQLQVSVRTLRNKLKPLKK